MNRSRFRKRDDIEEDFRTVEQGYYETVIDMVEDDMLNEDTSWVDKIKDSPKLEEYLREEIRDQIRVIYEVALECAFEDFDRRSDYDEYPESQEGSLMLKCIKLCKPSEADNDDD